MSPYSCKEHPVRWESWGYSVSMVSSIICQTAKAFYPTDTLTRVRAGLAKAEEQQELTGNSVAVVPWARKSGV